MTTLHLVYPYGDRNVAPWTIGNNLAAAARVRGYDVLQYDWAQPGAICPVGDDDVLIGHPHPVPGHVFTASLWANMRRWSRVVAMTPWGGLSSTEAMLYALEPVVNRFALICGPTWAARVPAGLQDKSVCVDMAVDRAHYPRVRHHFAGPGHRRILYVGCTVESKGTDRLTRLIGRGATVFHIGPGFIPDAYECGYIDTTSVEARELASECDFIIAPGRNDANPTTVLEGASWGLLPLVTEGAGWGEDVAVRVDDDLLAVDHWLNAPTEHLEAKYNLVQSALDIYNWSGFCSQILDLI